MLNFDINIFAVIITWLINIMVGAFWYSPAAFGKTWEKLTGIDIMAMPKPEANKAISFVAVSAIFQALTLAVIIRSINVVNIIDGLAVGFVLWLGLTAATSVGVTFYSHRTWKFWWLNSSFFLIVMLINSVILSVWR